MKSHTHYKSDIKYTLRQLTKKPGFTLLSILVLAGGLAISIIALTFVNNAFYREAILPNGEVFYRICAGSTQTGCRRIEAFEFSELRNDIKTMDYVGVFQRAEINIEYRGRYLPTFESAASVEWTVFQGVKPLLGRTLQAHDQVSGAEPVVVVDEAYWQGFLGGDDSVIGSIITIQDQPTKIVGVMPADFSAPANTNIWVPLPEQVINPSQNRDVGVFAFGRLKAGETEQSASNEINNLMKQMRQRYPTAPSSAIGCRWMQLACDRGFVGSGTNVIDGTLFNGVIAVGLTLLTGLIFLLACLNVGTLLLARTNERLKDVSIRVALGAPRMRLLWQTMGESVAIAIVGGLLALLLTGAAFKGTKLIVSSIIGAPTFGFKLQINSSIFVGTIIYLSLAILLTSVLPCWKIVNGDFNSVMRDGTRGAVGLKSGRFSQFLVVVAIATISILIFVGTVGINRAWLARDFASKVNTDNFISAQPVLETNRYSAYERLQFYQSLNNSLLQEDSVDSVFFESLLGRNDFEKETEADNETAASSRTPAILMGIAGPIETLGGVLLEGRDFGEFDISTREEIAIISRNTAEKLWPNESAIGKRIRVYDPLDRQMFPWRRVVGVVNETASPNSVENMIVANAAVYYPLTQLIHLSANQVTISLRAKPGSTDNAARNLQRNIYALDNQIPFFEILREDATFGTLKKFMDFLIAVISGCVVFSLLVAVVGIYGLTQNAINLLTQEVGTKRALGATDKTISRFLLLRVSKQLIAGIGVASALLLPIIGLAYIANISAFIVVLQQSYVLVLSALAALYAVMLFSIYQPIKNMLRMEPSEALRHV